MKYIIFVAVCLLPLVLAPASGNTMIVVADSTADFSRDQGTKNWYYGTYKQTTIAGSDHKYETSSFQLLDQFNSAAKRWEGSDSLFGNNKNSLLYLNAEGGHPDGLGLGAQESIIWVVRRYVSEVDGLLHISYDLRKKNYSNLKDDTITGRIFINGVEVVTQSIGNDDKDGVQGSFSQYLSAGAIVDFVLDPTGKQPSAGSDALASSRAEGAILTATIAKTTASIPEPSSILLFAIGVGILAGLQRRDYFRYI